MEAQITVDIMGDDGQLDVRKLVETLLEVKRENVGLRERLDEDRGEAGAGSRGNELGVRVRPEEERREERFQEGVEDLRARIGRGQERMIPLRY